MKHILSMLLLVVMLFGFSVPIVASGDLGSGDGYSVIPSLGDDEPFEYAQAEDARQAADDVEVIEPPEDTAGDEGDEIAHEVDVDVNVGGLDFSSQRLLVGGVDEADIEDADTVVAAYEDVYLLQFDSEEAAAEAYTYYYETADTLDIDTPLVVAEAIIPVEAQSDESIEVTEDNNPLSVLAEIVESETAEAIQTVAGGKIIALIDTGVSPETTVLGAYSVLGGSVYDDHGHGTRMADIIRGVSPDAGLVSIKAVDENGRGSVSSIYAAMQLAIELDVDIINLSVYGRRSTETGILETIINEAVSAGITVVGAAGNSGSDASWYVPGYIGSAVIVGSINEGGYLRAFSNFGASVDYYVVSDSTSEAAAKVSGLLSCLGDSESVLDAPDVVASYNTNVPEDFEDTEDPPPNSTIAWSARMFLYVYLTSAEDVVDAYGLNHIPTIEELTGYIVRSVDEASYASVIYSIDVWNAMSDENRQIVNEAVAVVDAGLTYEKLAHEAHDYAYEHKDGLVSNEFAAVNFETEQLEAHTVYSKVNDVMLVTEPESFDNDELILAAYTSTSVFSSDVSAKWENYYDTLSYYAYNGSTKIMNLNNVQFKDYYTNTTTTNSFGAIYEHFLNDGSYARRAYCARPTGSYPSGYNVTNSAGGAYWNKLSWDQIYGLVKALGYSNYIIGNYYYESAVAAATQIVVWSVTGGHMNKWGEQTGSWSTGYFWNRAYNLTDSGTYWAALSRIRDQMYFHGVKPSFAYDSTAEANANPYEMEYDSVNGVYTHTWTADGNATSTTWSTGNTWFRDYCTFTALDDDGNPIDGVTFTKTANTVTMTATREAMAASDVITS